jgi:hypothetical protein
MGQEIRVNSWNELQDRLYQDSWQPDLKRFRSPYVFRGMTSSDYRLASKLSRLGGDYKRLEHHLLRNFRKYAIQTANMPDTIWNWLSLAQHHGLPTRLLDWTISPLVAAHFATANTATFHVDGAIWAVNHRMVHQMLPGTLRATLEAEGADFFTVEMLTETVESLQTLDRLAPDPFVIFFEPPSIDARIINQYAAFAVMSNPEAKFDEWLQVHPDCWFKIIISAGLKWEIRDKLDQANITERVLFPGLDGLSRWQGRYYTPKLD